MFGNSVIGAINIVDEGKLDKYESYRITNNSNTKIYIGKKGNRRKTYGPNPANIIFRQQNQIII